MIGILCFSGVLYIKSKKPKDLYLLTFFTLFTDKESFKIYLVSKYFNTADRNSLYTQKPLDPTVNDKIIFQYEC